MKGKVDGLTFGRTLANAICKSSVLEEITLCWDCHLHDEFFKTLAAEAKRLPVSDIILNVLPVPPPPLP